MQYDYKHAEPLRRSHHQAAVSRLQAIMAVDGIDALIAFRGDNFNWINTHQSTFLELGAQGMAMIVVPREGAPIGIASEHDLQAQRINGLIADWRVYRDWTGWESRYAEGAVDYANNTQLLNPEAASPGIDVLRAVIGEIGADKGSIACERDDLKSGVFRQVESALADVRLVNSTDIIRRANRIKTPYEIYNLRHSAYHQWRVTHEVMSSIKPGTTYAEIRRRIEVGAAETPDIDGIHFFMLYMGKTVGATMRHYDLAVKAGDFVSIDLGFKTRGYISDSGRAYFVGEPSNLQRRIADVYHEAHLAVREKMVPGARIGDLYDLAAEKVRAHGLSDFRRGHIGHGLACSHNIEEYPYIVHGSDDVLEPGMVMTLEVPFYGRDFGAYFEEDILLITETGNESLTSAPLGLNVLPC